MDNEIPFPGNQEQDGPDHRQRWNDPAYNGRTIHFASDDTGDEYRFRWPTTGHMNRYSREAMGGNVAKASRNLVMATVLFPDKSELEGRFEDKPGLPIALANEINKKTGLTEEFTEKN